MKKIFPLLLFIFFNFILANAQSWHTKVHETVFKEIADKNKTDIIVYLKLQADLSDADLLETKEEKGAFVFNKLTDIAEQSQRHLLETGRFSPRPAHPRSLATLGPPR